MKTKKEIMYEGIVCGMLFGMGWFFSGFLLSILGALPSEYLYIGGIFGLSLYSIFIFCNKKIEVLKKRGKKK